MKKIILAISILLFSCIDGDINSPPIFGGGLEKYAVNNGANVYFKTIVLNAPDQFTCFSGNVSMTKVGVNEYGGTANYTNDLLNRPGVNNVECTATNNVGATVATIGTIELIPNIAPTLVIKQPISICGNDGKLTFDAPLVKFPDTTYVTGAHYTLTQGTLPKGLEIGYYDGNLTGTTASGSMSVNSIKMTATTVAGSHQSSPFNITILSAPCL